MGQDKRAEQIGRQHAIMSFRGRDGPSLEHAGIVDQDGNPRMADGDAPRDIARLRQQREVGDEQFGLGLWGLPIDPLLDCRPAGRISPDQDHTMARARHAERNPAADASCGTGNNGDGSLADVGGHFMSLLERRGLTHHRLELDQSFNATGSNQRHRHFQMQSLSRHFNSWPCLNLIRSKASPAVYRTPYWRDVRRLNSWAEFHRCRSRFCLSDHLIVRQSVSRSMRDSHRTACHESCDPAWIPKW